MKHWRWFLIGAGVFALMFATSQNTVTTGLLLADVAAIGWAARIRLVLEPRWTLEDELAAWLM